MPQRNSCKLSAYWSDTAMTIYTIGYEGLAYNEFISLLRQHHIETVVDIRELPLSRKPGFSKNSLCNALNVSGLEYVHVPDLGCPKPVRTRYRDDGNWARYKEGFLKHLDSQTEAVSALATMTAISNCALLCFEADYNFCHRSMVADAVQRLNGFPVDHIQRAALRTAKTGDLAPAFA
jgi:uncharacterized protein (DUF488 family)